MPSTLDLDPSVDPLIGQTLGSKYTLDRLIGRGGMGHVYSATTTDDDGELSRRDIVVKVIAPPLAQQPQAMARFEREAKRLDGLRHSNIVEMYDYGRDGGRAYIAMERVDGELLSDYLAQHGALSLAEFVPIAAQILKGVGHAHSRDLMIRDIKPSNVMLCERKGRANFVKIIDFGLAKMLEGDEDITKQHFIGSSGYLSPEQIKGLDLDLRVDVYALGVLFYQMLSGRMPFEAENDTTLLYKHVHDFPTPLSEVLPAGHEVPDELVHLIHDCLEKSREDRPNDANEIVEKLIDCVPMSMFKLPPVSATAEHSAISALSTTALAAPAGQTASYLQREGGAGASSVTGQALTGEGVSPTAEHPAGLVTGMASGSASGLASVQLSEGAQGSKVGLIVGALAVVALLGIGGVVLFGGGDRSESEPAAAAAPSSAKAEGTDLDAVVTKAEQQVAKGELEAADIELAAIRSQLGDAPALAGRVERLDARIETGKLLAAAKQLDDKGMTKAAIEAYEAVLEVDASNVEARERIAELEASIAAVELPPPADNKPAPGPATGTKPEPAGTTNTPSTAKPASKPAAKPAADKPAADKPAADKPAADKPADKDNPFLPTKKKTDNGPFLPTEK